MSNSNASPNSPIDWDLAVRVATKTAGREPLAESYHYESLHADFAAATTRAIDLVGDYTRISIPRSDVGRVVMRTPWIEANVTAFRILLEPVITRIVERQPKKSQSFVGSRLTAVELGALLGWMSRRVLGQYDVFNGDVIYYVGPNILHIEKKYGFSPKEFRLWIAIHEMTHRAQFLGVPWMRDYFLGLVNELVSSFDPDPKQFFATLRKAASAGREKTAAPREIGLLGMITTPDQRLVMDKIQSLMSILEGHSDVVMNSAGGGEVPNAARFHHVFHERRMSASGFGGALQRLFGFEAKMRQYERGAAFIRAIADGGNELTMDELWKSAENLPTALELETPSAWLARVAEIDKTSASEHPNN